MRYKVFNPNRFMVPVMVKDGKSFNQINIQPKATVEVDSSQISDSLQNLASEPRNVLRMTRIVEDRKPVRKRVLPQQKVSHKDADKRTESAPQTLQAPQKVVPVQGKTDNNSGSKEKKNGGGK